MYYKSYIILYYKFYKSYGTCTFSKEYYNDNMVYSHPALSSRRHIYTQHFTSLPRMESKGRERGCLHAMEIIPPKPSTLHPIYATVPLWSLTELPLCQYAKRKYCLGKELTEAVLMGLYWSLSHPGKLSESFKIGREEKSESFSVRVEMRLNQSAHI